VPEVVARIEPPVGDAPGRARRLRVVVEDASLADAPAEVVAERVLDDVDLGGVRAIEVALDVAEVDPRHDYVCRAHLDVEGTGEVTSGDMVSTQWHPVLTRGHGDRATVPLQRV
jgi:putative lipoprotein